MEWTVSLRESVIDDLRHFGQKQGRSLLASLEKSLKENPLAETRNMKTLRPNRFAQRELRMFGKYRALFNVDSAKHVVIVLVVGEKRGNSLFVQGKEFTLHHESSSTQ
jgi:mRNA-degrading endonuclease RelE of RelBE toxin-antitoxin system